jgi:DNA-binding PadR family transcriptional regulator
MAAAETRLLVLGAVMLFEPVNGYQIRRELMSWRIDEWAHIKPGSIYSSLSTLTGQGHLARHDLVDGGRDVAVYTVTDGGKAEFARLFRDAMERVDPLAPLAFHTAVLLLPMVSRADFIDLLERRLEALRRAHTERLTAPAEGDPDASPPHLPAVADLWSRMDRTEREWLEQLLDQVRHGSFAFAGEPTVWAPPPDDPGWQMDADRRRYRQLLRG